MKPLASEKDHQAAKTDVRDIFKAGDPHELKWFIRVAARPGLDPCQRLTKSSSTARKQYSVDPVVNEAV